ncbi:MAG TPA: TIM barrel protein [Acidimicrobiales bacterium]|nr:TIM barrel protein [Acidimicrobiales bacterium]
MLRSVSIELMWSDRPYAARARAAAKSGFDLVDLWDSRTSDIDAVGAACRDEGIGVNGFFGNRDFSLCDPSTRREVRDEVARSLETALKVGARQLHVFSNAIRPGAVVVPSPPQAAPALLANCVDALGDLVELVRGSGVTLVLEHLNTVFLPGYFFGDASWATVAAREVDAPEVGVVVDCFHQQLCGGRLADHLIAALPWLVRFDVAEVPGRHEPGAGEIDFRFLRDLLDHNGWDGTVSFETVPSDGRPETAVRAIDEVFPVEWCRSPRSGTVMRGRT